LTGLRSFAVPLFSMTWRHGYFGPDPDADLCLHFVSLSVNVAILPVLTLQLVQRVIVSGDDRSFTSIYQWSWLDHL
jgi:hypothetical protein